jgi:hypothetical protein
MRRLLLVGIVLAVVMALQPMLAQPALALDELTLPHPWSSSAVAVGHNCVTQKSNRIAFVQSLLWAENYYANHGGNSVSQVDGVWGTNTYNALRDFQRDHGLPEDGCAGVRTYSSFQYYTHVLNGNSYTHMHMHKTCDAPSHPFFPDYGVCWYYGGVRQVRFFHGSHNGDTWTWKNPRTNLWCVVSTYAYGGSYCGSGWVNGW